jgi:Zn-finger nucleic acid-binding protein
MEQWETPLGGTLRISNPITLQRWIDNGEYKKLIDEGFIFAPYCGRFNTEVCECSKCRNKTPNRDELIKLLTL